MAFNIDKEEKKPKLIYRPFFNVGCKRIIPELFCPPISNQSVSTYDKFGSFKPAGGFWTTEDDGYANSNDWLLYMAKRADDGDYDLLHEKFSPDTVTVSLKKEAKLLEPKTVIELLILKELYPIVIDRKHSINNLIDYPKLSQKYDGIYISESLIKSSLLCDWCVPTLVLFNENVIDSYTNKTIEKYFDGCWLFIETEIDPEVRKIPTISSDYLEVFEKINELYLKVIKNKLNDIRCDNYKEFIEIISNIFDKLKEDNKELFNRLTNVVIPKALNIDKPLSPVEKSKYSEQTYYSLDCKLRTQNDDYLKDIYKRSLKK